MAQRVIHVSCRPSVKPKEPHRNNRRRFKTKVRDIQHTTVMQGDSIGQICNTVPKNSWNDSHINYIFQRENHIPMKLESNIKPVQQLNNALFPLSNEISLNLNSESQKQYHIAASNYMKENQLKNGNKRTGNCQCTYMSTFWYVLGIFIVFFLSAIIIVSLFILSPKYTAQTGTTTAVSYVWNLTGATVISELASNLSALVFDSTNAVYVVESSKNRVQKFIIGSTNSTTVAGQASGIAGTNSSFLNGPCDVAVDGSNNVYVLDQLNNRVQLWANGASIGITVAGNGGSGINVSQLEFPYFMMLNRNTGTIYIADTNNWRIMAYSSGSSTGSLVAGGNGAGTSTNQLYFPSGIYFDSSSNSFIIANVLGHNIVRWVLGDSNWTIIAGSTTGVSGNSSTMLDHPMGLTLDSAGNIYVADSYNHRIQLFLTGQSTGITIAGVNGVCGNDANKLCGPRALAFDARFNLYVADTQNQRIQMFMHV